MPAPLPPLDHMEYSRTEGRLRRPAFHDLTGERCNAARLAAWRSKHDALPFEAQLRFDPSKAFARRKP